LVRHVLSDFDLTRDEVWEILRLSKEMKDNPHKYVRALEAKTLIMLFQLPSLRTRVSFETAMTQLGGHAIYYQIGEGFTRGETLKDGVKTLSRYGDAMMVRVLSQEVLEEIARHSSIPVINGMTMRFHPCQNLGDLLTIWEKKGRLEGLKVAYVGDGGCNTAHSTLIGCSSIGMDVTVVCPEDPKYMPDPKIVDEARRRALGRIEVVHDPIEGVRDADVVYTDVWISAGMEAEARERLRVFPPYQVNRELLSHAKPDCIVMHCLPAHRGQEITDDVIDGPNSVVFDQAENRLHAQKGLLLWLLGGI